MNPQGLVRDRVCSIPHEEGNPGGWTNLPPLRLRQDRDLG